MNEKDIELAIKEDPRGEFCSKCHEKNTFADDCGWFYNELENGDYLPVCKNCNTTPPGDR